MGSLQCCRASMAIQHAMECFYLVLVIWSFILYSLSLYPSFLFSAPFFLSHLFCSFPENGFLGYLLLKR